MENYPVLQNLFEPDEFGDKNMIETDHVCFGRIPSLANSFLISSKAPENIDEELFHLDYNHRPLKTEHLLDNFPTQDEKPWRLRKNSTLSIEDTIGLIEFKVG